MPYIMGRIDMTNDYDEDYGLQNALYPLASLTDVSLLDLYLTTSHPKNFPHRLFVRWTETLSCH
jgi:hypothetical protein